MQLDRDSEGAGDTQNTRTVQVIKSGLGLRLDLVEGTGSAVAIVWPGMGAEHRSLHHFGLGPAARTMIQQHDSEAVYGVYAGEATITDLETGATAALSTGSMVHLEPGTPYRFIAGEPGAQIVGGPCPPDTHVYLQHGAV